MTDEPGVLAVCESWDEEDLRDAYEGVYGPGAVPYRLREEAGDEDDYDDEPGP